MLLSFTVGNLEQAFSNVWTPLSCLSTDHISPTAHRVLGSVGGGGLRKLFIWGYIQIYRKVTKIV